MIIDARNLCCPLPVLRARKVLMTVPAETRVEILVTDPAAARDFPLFCKEQGHVLESISPQADHIRIILRRGP